MRLGWLGAAPGQSEYSYQKYWAHSGFANNPGYASRHDLTAMSWQLNGHG